VELEADPEQEEDDPDLGHLLGQLRVGHEPRGVRADHDPGQQVPDDRRQADPVGQVPEDEGSRQPAGQSQDQVEVVHAVG
jgi:hypothetical protein